jgi:hypothetical protein
LLALLIDSYTTVVLDWEPETIRGEIKATYNVDVSQVNMDKVMALITVLTTNLFYISATSFAHVANALNNSAANFEVMDPVTPDEAAWALTEVTLNDPPKSGSDLEEAFSDEVRKFLGAILVDEGMTTPPAVLGMARMPSKPLENADTSMADDPIMFAGFYKLGQSKADDVTAYVKERTAKLIEELSKLPLEHRDSASWSRLMQEDKQHPAPRALD